MSEDIAIIKRLDVSVESFEDAVLQIMGQEKVVQSIFKTMRQKQHELVVARFIEGAIVDALIVREGNTNETIDKLVLQVGMSRSTLLDCRRFYLHDFWRRSLVYLEQWLSEQSINMSWARVKQKVAKQYSPEQPEYFAKESERLSKMAMSLDEQVEQFEQELEEFSTGELYLEGKGIVAKAKEITSDLIRRVSEIKDDTAPVRDKKYLEFIRKCPCCVTGATGSVQPHHIFSRGRGIKCSDYGTIPLDETMHARLHKVGQTTFCQEYGLDLWETIAQHIAMYSFGTRIF